MVVSGGVQEISPILLKKLMVKVGGDMDINSLNIEKPIIQDNQYKIIVSLIVLVVLGTLIYFSKDAYNGVLLKLKLCLYVQIVGIFILQVVSFLAKKDKHIKFYALGGFVLLFISSFYLDNFFFGSLAGTFLRTFICFSLVQIVLAFKFGGSSD